MHETTTITTTADLTHSFAIHAQMRFDCRRIVNTSRPPCRVIAGRLVPLTSWIIGFGHELHAHHTVEDAVLFSDLAARCPACGHAGVARRRPCNGAICSSSIWTSRDQVILALFVDRYTDESWKALNLQAITVLPKTGLSFTIPWNVEALRKLRPAHGRCLAGVRSPVLV